MGWEEEFGIQIPEADAASLCTVGAVEDYIQRRVREKQPDANEEKTHARVRKIIVEILHVKPEQLHRDTHFIHDLNCG